MYNFGYLAPKINIAFCIESDKTLYFPSTEYTPFGSNCQIYGQYNSCYKCMPGYYLTNPTTTSSQCVAKSGTTGRCPDSGTYRTLQPLTLSDSVTPGAIDANVKLSYNAKCVATVPGAATDNYALVVG